MKALKLSWLLSRPYETQVTLLISILGAIRLVLALVFDFMSFNAVEVAIDIAFLCCFGGLFILVAKKSNIKSVHPLFGFILTLLLALNFLQFGGVMGDSRFNFLCGLCVIVLLYSRVWLVLNLLFMLGTIVLLCLHAFFPVVSFGTLIVGARIDVTNFVFGMGSIAVFVYYLKYVTVKEIDRFDSLNLQLQRNVRQARDKNKNLVTQSHELFLAQRNLEHQVNLTTQELEEKNKSIESYIAINTQILTEPVAELVTAVEQLPDDRLSGMAKTSAIELQSVLNQIKLKLQTERR